MKGEKNEHFRTHKIRLAKDRVMTSITLHVPVDVVERMKDIAHKRGFADCEALVKANVSEGLHRDEAAQFVLGAQAVPDEATESEWQEILAVGRLVFPRMRWRMPK